MAVLNLFRDLGINPVSVNLGEVNIDKKIDPEMYGLIRKKLQDLGFDIIGDGRSRIIEKIKNTIIEMVHRDEPAANMKLSSFIESKLFRDYNYLSNLFSSSEGITIEKFYIRQKVERIKELLLYNEMNLGEIAYRMGYSSASHLSNQFRQVTGITPGRYRQVRNYPRRPIDRISNR